MKQTQALAVFKPEFHQPCFVVLALLPPPFRHRQLEERGAGEVMHQEAKAQTLKRCDLLGNDRPKM